MRRGCRGSIKQDAVFSPNFSFVVNSCRIKQRREDQNNQKSSTNISLTLVSRLQSYVIDYRKDKPDNDTPADIGFSRNHNTTYVQQHMPSHGVIKQI